MWICKAVFALAVVLFTVKAQELEETEGKKFYVKSVRNWFLRKFIFSLLHMGCSHCRPLHTVGAILKLIFLSSLLTKKIGEHSEHSKLRFFGRVAYIFN